MSRTVTVTESGDGLYTQDVEMNNHVLIADEATDLGGLDKGPAPYDLLLAALGTCTSMTLRMYANQKQWDLKKVTVKLEHRKEVDQDKKRIDIITRNITVDGDLTHEQKDRLLEIADKCPVHRTLMDSPRPQLTSIIND